jgi:putative proteasome-type protease
MTYCLGLCLDDGLVFASDSRTNAGVDYVTTYSKMHVFTPAPDRLFVILSAGNLATTQEVMNHIQRDMDYPSGTTNLANVRYLFEAAEYVGRISLQVQQEHNAALASAGVSGETTLLIGGQIQGQAHGLMLIYPQGNYITASAETPYLQIGESKYGKPALDRIAEPGMSLEQGAQLVLVSLDATTRSNITVGPPFEVAVYERDTLTLRNRCKFDERDPYLIQVRETWNEGIREGFSKLPKFNWNDKPADLDSPGQAVAQCQIVNQQTGVADPNQPAVISDPSLNAQNEIDSPVQTPGFGKPQTMG